MTALSDQIVFASSNENKVRELRSILQIPGLEILSLKDIGWEEEIEETGATLEDNALIKCRAVAEYHDTVLAEDTGLEVTALGMAPGVYTARYAGPRCDADDNMNKLLSELKNKKDRSARFRTVLALITDGKEYIFEGIVNGKIAEEKRGAGGFGYDPVFIPEGYTESFAELDKEIKNRISHRARALHRFKMWIGN